MYCPDCPTQTVVDPPIKVYEDIFHPQMIQVIHPVEIVRRHHCVPVPYHVVAYTERDETCNVSSLNKRKAKKR